MAFSRPSLRSVLTSLVPVALLIAAGTVWLSKGRLVGPSAPAVSLYRRHILQSEAAEAKPVIAQTVFNLYGARPLAARTAVRNVEQISTKC